MRTIMDALNGEMRAYFNTMYFERKPTLVEIVSDLLNLQPERGETYEHKKKLEIHLQEQMPSDGSINVSAFRMPQDEYSRQYRQIMLVSTNGDEKAAAFDRGDAEAEKARISGQMKMQVWFPKFMTDHAKTFVT